MPTRQSAASAICGWVDRSHWPYVWSTGLDHYYRPFVGASMVQQMSSAFSEAVRQPSRPQWHQIDNGDKNSTRVPQRWRAPQLPSLNQPRVKIESLKLALITADRQSYRPVLISIELADARLALASRSFEWTGTFDVRTFLCLCLQSDGKLLWPFHWPTTWEGHKPFYPC